MSHVLQEQLKQPDLPKKPILFVEIPITDEHFGNDEWTTAICGEYDDSYLGSFSFFKKNVHYLKNIGIALLVIMVIMVLLFSILGEPLGTYNYIALALVPLTISIPFFWSFWLGNKCLRLRKYDDQQQSKHKMQNANIERIKAQNEKNYTAVYKSQQEYKNQRDDLKQQGFKKIRERLSNADRNEVEKQVNEYSIAFNKQFPPITDKIDLNDPYARLPESYDTYQGKGKVTQRRF